MALGAKEASSSNSFRWAFHVFLSFRGEDTRKTFTDHLYAALQRKGMKTFRDDEEIEKGDVVSQELRKAIEQSLSSIVILSQNYASSTWCLDELQKILESRKELGREVFPIFYGVDPSDIRHQKGSFEKAFRNHEEKFGKDKEKLRTWRAALKEIANLSGWDSKNLLPENLNENEALEELDVGGTAIREVPSSIVHLENLKSLSFRGCQGPTSSSWSLHLPFGKLFQFWKDPVSTSLRLPSSISSLASLQILNLSYCNLSAGLIPNDLGCIPSLKDLNLRGNNFGNIPGGSSVLPPSFSSLTSLNILNLSDCNLHDGSIPEDLSSLSSLQQLNFMGNNFANLPANCLSNLLELQLLWINSCPNIQSLPELPPNLQRLDASDNVSMEALSDPKELWSLFASLDLQRSEGHVLLHVPGSEVPSWFHNRSFYFDEEMRNHYNGDSAVSIVAEIPNSWRSSEWSGIAICLVLEGQVWEDLWERCIFWSCKSPDDDEWPRGLVGCDVQGSEDRPQLFIRFLPFNHHNCWQYVRGENSQLQFMLLTKTRPRWGAQHLEAPRPRKLEIKKCGWRSLCKEDVDRWRLLSASATSECNINSTDICPQDSMGFRLHKDKRCRDVFEAEASASDAEAETQLAQRRKL